ncbi:hypothetical protein Pf1_00677 [Flavobacterium columnare]|nr:hypothetical protein Pf1_00677 [Flavobacterium columnare]
MEELVTEICSEELLYHLNLKYTGLKSKILDLFFHFKTTRTDG